MPITGWLFMRVVKKKTLVIAKHALERLHERASIALSEQQAHKLFRRSYQIPYEEARALGYRSNYYGRLEKGQKSWYFRTVFSGHDLILVIAESHCQRETVIWVTSFARKRENTPCFGTRCTPQPVSPGPPNRAPAAVPSPHDRLMAEQVA